MFETIIESITAQRIGERKVYYPRSLDAGMKLIRRTRTKYGNRATCHLRVQNDEVTLTIEIL